LVARRIRVTEQEINNFLKSADAQVWASPDYHLGHILIALPSSPTSEAIAAAEEKADKLYEKLSEGANFAEAAISNSSGPDALEGGDLGWRKSSQLPTLFANVADSLEVGQVSKPHRSQAGFHLLKLYEKREQDKEIINQTRARHILIKTSEIMDDDLAKSRLEDIREQIIAGAEFEKMAKAYSEDIGSRMSGGDLGWTSPGVFTPAFETKVKDTDIDEISEPFKSTFGWHILQVTGRRAEDFTEEAMRSRAHNMLMSRRFEDEMQVWLQELRDEAFVEIKI
jgi:peptidyl-prolyl cis-trans isomerase SurA